jgi:hypothetical protein
MGAGMIAGSPPEDSLSAFIDHGQHILKKRSIDIEARVMSQTLKKGSELHDQADLFCPNQQSHDTHDLETKMLGG